jgi:hypothetical protein
MLTLADAEIAFYKTATGQSVGTISDLEFKYYSGLSGLTPVNRYTLQDHKRAYWSGLTGITKASLADLEMAYLDTIGIAYGSLNNRRYLFFNGGGVPPRTGTLDAVLPPLSASFNGFIGRMGAVAATLPPLTATFSGTTGGLLPVQFIGSTSGSVDSATSFTVAWNSFDVAPAVGDEIIFIWSGLQTSVMSLPAGFTHVGASPYSDGTNLKTLVIKRKYDGTETGSISFTTDTAQRMSCVGVAYRGVDDVLPATTPTNPPVTTGGGTVVNNHVIPAITPGTDNPVFLYIHSERASAGNSTSTVPGGVTKRKEASLVGTGGTYQCVSDDGLVTAHPNGVLVASPGNYGTTVATGRYHTFTLALTRVPFSQPPVANNKPLMGASTSNNTNFNTLNGVAGPLSCRRIFLGNIAASTTWQNSATSQETGTGRRCYLSFKPTNMTTFATDLTAQGNFSNFLDTIPVDQEVVITCFHEPEQEINAGQFTLAQWKAAVQKCGEIIHNKNRPLLRNAFILMGGWSFDNNSPYNAYDWITWSDPSKIDVIGIDPYIETSNDPSISTILTVNNSGKGSGSNDSALTNLLTINKPFFIGEWGVTETNKTLTQKATEITNFYNWMKNTWNPAHPNNKFEAAIYFNNNLDVPSDPDRTWELHDAPLDAFVAACADSRT